jgi:hypothetical protein
MQKTSKMPNLLTVVCVAALTSGMAGCHHSGNTSTSDAAQDEFVQAFLTAHDSKTWMRKKSWLIGMM